MRFCAVLLLPVLLAIPASALEPYLVKDVNPSHSPGSSSPSSFVTLGEAALFAALEPDTGFELWTSDGSAAGTHRLVDIVPGERHGSPLPFAVTPRLYFFTVQEEPSTPRTLWATDGTPAGTARVTEPGLAVDEGAVWAPAQGALYFAAADELHGQELWTSDGSPGSARLVADLLPGERSSWPVGLTCFKGRLWFGAEDREGRRALWHTDGVSTGLFRRFGANMDARPVAAAGGRLLFVVSDVSGSQDLWATDGTARGTAPLLRLSRRKAFAWFWGFARYGRRVFFAAEDGRRGRELWVTDGTAAGTRVLTSFAAREPFHDDAGNPNLSYASALAGGRLVFTAWFGERVEVWATDGTPAGTGRLWSCPGECPEVAVLWPVHRGLVYWVAEDAERGRELWVTDGTSAGTRLVLDLCPGSCSAAPEGPFVVGDRLLFNATDGTHGRELWSTDGTASGTFRVSDFDSEEPWRRSLVVQGTVAGGRLVFAAEDGLHGAELWTTDGTPEGTGLVRDINVFELGGSYPELLGALGSTAFFFGDDGVRGFELWKSDGTEAGTSLVAELTAGEAPYGPPARPPAAELGGALFFIQHRTPDDAWLLRTDGTAAGTVRVTPEGVDCCFPELAAAGGRLFFTAPDRDHGPELWATDGTAAGTHRVADLVPGSAGSFPRELTILDGALWFMAADEDGNRWLWQSDGTEAGTVRVAGLGVLHFSARSLLTAHAGRLWFFASDGEQGLVLWVSDGTAAGTAPAVDLAPGAAGFLPALLVSLGEKLVVSGSVDGGPDGLWATDGTPESTERIGDAWYSGSAWTVFQERLFYSPYSRFGPVPGLVVTDGTEEGTRTLPFPGGGSEPASSFAPLGDRLLFMTAGGRRLWETDGTAVSAVTAEGFEPFEGAALLTAGPRIFLQGYAAATGVELWAVEE